jgi:hypothetical protein
MPLSRDVGFSRRVNAEALTDPFGSNLASDQGRRNGRLRRLADAERMQKVVSGRPVLEVSRMLGEFRNPPTHEVPPPLKSHPFLRVAAWAAPLKTPHIFGQKSFEQIS